MPTAQALLMLSLANELANEVRDLMIRQLAGIQLKNCLTAKAADVVAQKQAAWLAIGAPERSQIKTTVLGALGSPQGAARHTAAQVIGAIGVIEVDGLNDIEWLKRRFVEEGVWIRPFGNIVYTTPPLIISEADLRQLTHTMIKVLHESAAR